MRRMQLIAVALCLIMLATVGAGVVAAKQDENANHAGKSSVYFVDVVATATHGPGKLMINLDQHRFVFNGVGFDRSKTYLLRYTVKGIAGVHTFASGKATPSGNLHVEGTWMIDLRLLPEAPAVTASTSPVRAVLGMSYGPAQTGGHAYYLTATGSVSSAGAIVRYVLEETTVYANGGASAPEALYDGNNAHLSSNTQGYLLVIPNSGFSMIVATLTAYDSAGNSDTTELVWYPSS